MKFHAECVACLIQSSLKKAERVGDDHLRAEYMKKICEIMSQTDLEYDSAPLVDARLIRLRRDFLKLEEDYGPIKHEFNALLLNIYDRLEARVRSAEDPLYAAVQLSIAGNYIDYGVVKDVSAEKLMELIEKAADTRLDPTEYAHLREELAQGGEVVFLHDNCGEIVLDKLLLETIHRLYPQIQLVSVVRGAAVQNDATIEDAREIGLDRVAEVIGNGGNDIAGTQLDLLPGDTLSCIENARLVFSKGQGNFETLIGCQKNIYYLFLCKCDRFVEWFGMERYSGVFMNERRLRV